MLKQAAYTVVLVGVGLLAGLYLSPSGGDLPIDTGAADLSPHTASLSGDLNQAKLTDEGLIIKGSYLGLGYPHAVQVEVRLPTGQTVIAEETDQTSMVKDEGVYMVAMSDAPSGEYTIKVKSKTGGSYETKSKDVVELQAL